MDRIGLNNLENALTQFGNQQRSDVQTSIGNARANQQMDMAKEAQALNQKYFQKAQEQQAFQEQQQRQGQAVSQFGSLVQMEAKVNPYLANSMVGLMGSADKDPQAQAQLMQLMNANPDLMGAAKRVYSRLDKGAKTVLPSMYASILGGPGDMAMGGQGQSNPSYATNDILDYAAKKAQADKEMNQATQGTDQNNYSPEMTAKMYGMGNMVKTPTTVPTLTPLPTPPPVINQALQRLKIMQLKNLQGQGYQLQPGDLSDIQNFSPVQPSQLP